MSKGRKVTCIAAVWGAVWATATTAHTGAEEGGREDLGYHRYDTTPGLGAAEQRSGCCSRRCRTTSRPADPGSPKVNGATVTSKYDVPTTAHHRSGRHKAVSTQEKTITKHRRRPEPGRDLTPEPALTGELLTAATSKAADTTRPALTPRTRREPAQQAAS